MILDQNSLQNYLNYSNNPAADFMYSLPGMALEAYATNMFGLRSKTHFIRERASLEISDQMALKTGKGKANIKARELAKRAYENRREKWRSSVGLKHANKPSWMKNYWENLSFEEKEAIARKHGSAGSRRVFKLVSNDTKYIAKLASESSHGKRAAGIRSNIRATEARWNRMGYVLAAGYAIDIGANFVRQAFMPSLRNDGLANFDGQVPTLLDNNRTYTGRQRALMAIHNSQLMARAVLGNEAMYLSG